jgi:hypothetical protein
MRNNSLNLVQEILLKKRLRECLLLGAKQAREEREARGEKRPTFIYSGFKRAWHVVFD